MSKTRSASPARAAQRNGLNRLQSDYSCVCNLTRGSSTWNTRTCCCFTVNTYSGNQLLCYNQFSVFVVGAGGFGGRRASEKARVRTPPNGRDVSEHHLVSGPAGRVISLPQAPLPPPRRAPDAVVVDSTTRDQVSASLKTQSRFGQKCRTRIHGVRTRTE